MAAIVVQQFITLDGVMQAGGGPDEDRDGGFEHGGWARDYDAEHDSLDEGGTIIAEWESRTESLLLGRRTYEIWADAWGVWPEDAPGFQCELTRRYNRVPKYVASRSLTELAWTNARLLDLDLPAHVARLKNEPLDGEIHVWGSTRLVRTLAEHGLVDEYRLMVYPLVLGTGKKLFPEGFPLTRLDLVNAHTLASRVQVCTYRPIRA